MHFGDFQEEEVKPTVEITEPREEEVVVTIEKPPAAEPTPITWKRARLFPMIFKKVRGLAERRGIVDLEEEDKDYLKLTLDQEEEASESTVESEEESSDYTEYTETESEFSYSETTEEEEESETPEEEEESSTPESESSTESEGEKARKNIFLARRRPVVEEVVEVKGKKRQPPEEPEELQVEEAPPAEGEESELAMEEPTDLEPQVVTEEGSMGSASVEGVGSEEESSTTSSSESQSGGPWGFQVPEYDRSRSSSQRKPPGAEAEGYNTAL